MTRARFELAPTYVDQKPYQVYLIKVRYLESGALDQLGHLAIH